MNFRGRDSSDSGNPNKMELGEPRRFGGGDIDDKPLDISEERRFDSGRGRRPFGRGRRFSPPGRQRDYGYGRDDQSMMRDRSPIRGHDRFSDQYKKDDGNFSKRDDGRKDMGRQFFDDDSRRMEWKSRGNSFDGPGNNYKSRGMGYTAPSGQKGFISEGFPKPNECEIIAVNKQQRAYAESVEARVKSIGLLVDVLFLKDEALLTQTIDDIARRGSLYAMVISPQNETHGSVTVNLLHGTPQEHRNMPLEDALKLVSRNFHDYIRTQKENMERERAERGPYEGCVAADREVQLLLRMLADGRWISLTEINAVIRYLTERRDKLQLGGPGEDRSGRRPPATAAENKLDPPFAPKENVDVAQKEHDLQNRIMNIMNQGAPQKPLGSSLGSSALSGVADLPARSNSLMATSGTSSLGIKSGASAEDTFPKPLGLGPSPGRGEPQSDFSSTGTKLGSGDSAATPTFLNFNNPSVQKALDSLIQSGPSLLKNISMTNPSQSAASSGAGAAQQSGDRPLGGMGRGGMGQDRGGSMDVSPPRSDMGPAQRGGPDSMGPPPQRGGGSFGGGMSDMGRGGGYGPGGMADSGGMRGPSPIKDMGRMGGQFGGSGSNQFGKFQGPGGQQGGGGGGGYSSSYNNPNMGRQNFGGNQGMGGGGGPRRY